MSSRVRGVVERWTGSRPTDPAVVDLLAELEAAVSRQEQLVRDAVGDLTDRLAALERRIAALETGAEDA